MTSPITVGGDDDPGGRDPVAADVAGSVANAVGRYNELQSDTFGQGSVVGDLIDLPPVPEQGSKHSGGDDSGYPD